MFPRLRFLLSYFVVWVIFFEVARLLFLFYNLSAAKETSLQNRALSFWYGLRMDISVAAYLVLPLCVLVIASIFLPFFRKRLPYKIYHCLLLFPLLLIVLADLELYKSWGFRLDATPLKYIQSPKEIWASISHLPLLLILIVFLFVYVTLCLMFNRFLKNRISLLEDQGNKVYATAAVLICTGLLIIPMRGGLQLSPLNQSSVYFSRQNFANILAINAAWNFMYGIEKGAPSENPYRYLGDAQVKLIVDSLYASGNATEIVVDTARPNIILVIWESLTSKAIEQSIGGKSITPGFHSLMKEGIFFSHLYSSGDRTDKGVASVLSGYPAMNNVSIIRFPNKSATINTLPSFFDSIGYQTSFYYGGETEFANIKSFLLQGGFDQMTDKNDFARKDLNSKWGAHDGVVARRIQEDLARVAQPFFLTWLTLSSHEPFETPTDKPFKGNDHASQFASSLHYTDQVLLQFVDQCKKQSWWNNTVLIIVADHGHSLLKPSNWIENFRIPMLWLGGALNRKGTEVSRTASQNDLATTLVQQLVDDKTGIFPYSRNIFDTTSGEWAFFSFNNGFGLAQPEKILVFDHVGKQIILEKGSNTQDDLLKGKALQQYYYQDFLTR